MADEQDFLSLPLEERLSHTAWKARLGAYEELSKSFENSRSDTDECFDLFNARPEVAKKMLTDSNVVALETGIQAFTEYLKYGGTVSNVSKLRSAGIVNAIVEKGLASSRAKTKEYAAEAILQLVEISDDPNGIVEELFPLLKHRLPKLVAGVVNVLYQLVDNYGTRVILPKPILPHLAKLFAHADRNVRAEATKLAVALNNWMGNTLETVLFPELKPVQQKDLTKAFEANTTKNVEQKRLTRKQLAEKESAAAAAAAAAATEQHDDGDVDMADASESHPENTQDADPYEYIDPIEVLSKIPGDFDSRISSAKWKDRKEVLEEIVPVFEKAVKMVPEDDYGHLIRTFAKCMKDANIQVVQLAADCTRYIVRGIGKDFNKYQQIILGPMIERTKEKKASVATALADALDAMFAVSSLGDILEDVLAGQRHKTPQVKISSTNYLQRCLATTSVPPVRLEVDQIMEVGVKLLGESLEPVRQAAAEMIGTMMKITGERELNGFLEKIDDNRRAKIHAFYETVDVKCKNIKQIPTRVTLQQKKSPALNKNPAVKPQTSESRSSTIPAKRGATSPAKRADEAPKVSTYGRGLTARSLTSSKQPNLQPPRQPVEEKPPYEEYGVNSAEREELLELRAEKLEWVAQKERDSRATLKLKEENIYLNQELTQLKSKMEYINKDHTNALLMVKQKETQILRLNSDLESARLKIRDLEQTIEMMKLQKNQAQTQQHNISHFQSPSVRDSLPAFNSHLPVYSRPFSPNEKAKMTSGELSSRVKRLSIDADGFRESPSRTTSNTFGDFASPHRASPDSFSSDHGTDTANVDSWKRAAEVTSQLKARIEKMKARSRNAHNVS